jgi:hypothetical protein
MHIIRRGFLIVFFSFLPAVCAGELLLLLLLPLWHIQVRTTYNTIQMSP